MTGSRTSRSTGPFSLPGVLLGPLLGLLVAAVLLEGLAGCSGEDTEGSRAATSTATVTVTAEPTAPPRTSDPSRTPRQPDARPVAIRVPLSADGAAFVTPSGNIACLLSRRGPQVEARCDIAEREYADPQRPSDCSGDFGSSIFLSGARSGIGCVSDSVFGTADTTSSVGSDYVSWFDPRTEPLVAAATDPSHRTQAGLAYDHRIAYGPVTCTSEDTGVTCTNLVTRATFTLSRTGYETGGAR